MSGKRKLFPLSLVLGCEMENYLKQIIQGRPLFPKQCILKMRNRSQLDLKNIPEIYHKPFFLVVMTGFYFDGVSILKVFFLGFKEDLL